MELTKLMEDIDGLYTALLAHPYLIDHPEKREVFHGLYTQCRQAICDELTFLDAATSLTCWFRDGHTNIELPYKSSDLCIPLPSRWYDEQLFTTEQYGTIPAGSELTFIEGLPLYMVVKQLLPRIPHENIFLVKSRLTEYPYRNYHLFSHMNLAFLFGEKAEYTLTYYHKGQEHTATLPLVPYNGFLDHCDDNFVSWHIEQGHAVLRLDACICNQAYENALEDLARACQDQTAVDLTLDLSRNMGGTSEVIEKFLEYVDVDTFHRYEMVDYSEGKPVCVCSRNEMVSNHRRPHLFPKQIFCKTGNTSFSSARTFAVTLHDNRIASIIGEPTGGSPSSYGMPRKQTLANTGIRLRVSRAWFGRPDPTFDPEDTLAPESYFLHLIHHTTATISLSSS